MRDEDINSRTFWFLGSSGALVYDGIYVHSIFVDIKKSGQLWAARQFYDTQ